MELTYDARDAIASLVDHHWTYKGQDEITPKNVHRKVRQAVKEIKVAIKDDDEENSYDLGDEHDEYIEAMLWLKLWASQMRLKGHINAAMSYENRYEDLMNEDDEDMRDALVSSILNHDDDEE